MTGDLVDLPALGPDGEYRTRNREIIRDTAGVPVAESSLVPRLFVNRSIDAQRKLRPLPTAQREAALTRAADAFVSSTIAGLDFDSYVELTCRVSGLPIVRGPGGRSRCRRIPRHRIRCRASGPAVGCQPRLARRRSLRRRGVGEARRGARGPRTGQRARRARSLAAGVGARLPGGDPSVAARALHRRTGSSRRCGRRGFAQGTRCTCRPTTPSPTTSSRQPTWRWSTAARTSSTDTGGIRRCSPTGPAAPRS